MEQKNHKNNAWVKVVLIICLIVAAFAINNTLEKKQKEQTSAEDPANAGKRQVEYAKPVEDDNPILQAFREKFTDAEVLIACEEDVTDDGCKDLVVIYRSGDLTRTVVAIDSGDGKNYQFSAPIPAPIENQKIQFKNIDKEAEIEIIITGEKKGAVGYAIYRIIDGEPADLFGEGMEDCC